MRGNERGQERAASPSRAHPLETKRQLHVLVHKADALAVAFDRWHQPVESYLNAARLWPRCLLAPREDARHRGVQHIRSTLVRHLFLDKLAGEHLALTEAVQAVLVGTIVRLHFPYTAQKPTEVSTMFHIVWTRVLETTKY
jgi:hypothetical protein